MNVQSLKNEKKRNFLKALMGKEHLFIIKKGTLIRVHEGPY
jgi:hypothetical protein